MRTSRLEAFSDGVLAIIITIMVLELHRPEQASWYELWKTTGASLLSYLLSFVYVGVYWTNHHHMFQLTERVTGGILWANLILLFFLSLLPLTTDWADETDYAQAPVVIYGVNLFAAGVAYYLLQTTIIRSQGPGSRLRKAIGRDFKGKGSMVGYLLAIVAALAGGAGKGWDRPGIWVAVAFAVAVAALWVVPDRRIETIMTPVPEIEADPRDPDREA